MWTNNKQPSASGGVKMATKSRYLFGAVISLTLLVVFLTFLKTGSTPTVSAGSQDDNFRDLPVLDYEAETTKEKSKARIEKDEHFKGRGNPGRGPITELPNGIEPLPTNVHWWLGLSAIPVDQSDLIVLGDVLAREAHLSSDRTGIHSEFTVQITEVLKGATNQVVAGSRLFVNRLGGSVRFGSGKIQNYGLSGQGMPHASAHYVLFLGRTVEGDLLILTGYELSGTHVIPLDGEDSKDPKGDLPFAKYRGADQTKFIKEVRDAVTRSTTGGAQ
jgi:hypothetical protein